MRTYFNLYWFFFPRRSVEYFFRYLQFQEFVASAKIKMKIWNPELLFRRPVFFVSLCVLKHPVKGCSVKFAVHPIQDLFYFFFFFFVAHYWCNLFCVSFFEFRFTIIFTVIIFSLYFNKSIAPKGDGILCICVVGERVSSNKFRDLEAPWNFI